jgi:hypothetical protein
MHTKIRVAWGAALQATAKITFACEGDFCAFDFLSHREIFLYKSKAKISDAYGIRNFDRLWWFHPELRLKQCKTVKSFLPV